MSTPIEVESPAVRQSTIAITHLREANDALLAEIRALRSDVKKYSRLTILDGVGLAIGMFIALPILLFIAGMLLTMLGLSILPRR